ncbi:MAG: hypothetical protein HRU20_30110 [Pseudomonadales bacterium]|nr:hypothetical protein [Pseudomonadales bacterium]
MDENLKSFLVIAIPVLANLIFSALVAKKVLKVFWRSFDNIQIAKKILTLGLVSNLIASILFGASIAVGVLFSADPAWVLMPLFMGPIEYWLHYFPYIFVWLLVLVFSVLAFKMNR